MNTTPTNCATGTLEVFVPTQEQPWDQRRLLHLTRRMGFGIEPSEIVKWLGMPPHTVVERLVGEAMSEGKMDGVDGSSILEEWQTAWAEKMINGSLKQKWMLFWHNHFVTEFDSYKCVPYLMQYFQTLEEHALGNFKEFVHDIGLTSAMLLYLNLADSRKANPNENYARELLELFTLGRDQNYTQMDIQEIARAFTGYKTKASELIDCSNIEFKPHQFDNTEKTIFGHTGNHNYTDVIDLIFDVRANEVALHLAKKIYTHFVNPVLHEDFIAELANYIIDVDFEISDIIKKLFSSEHFFDEYNIGVVIKSPYDLFVGTHKKWLPVSASGFLTLIVRIFLPRAGQVLFSPPNVAGWEGNQKWLNSQSISYRFTTLQFIGISMSEMANRDIILQRLKRLVSSNNDVKVICREVVDFMMINGLQIQQDYDLALIAFKADVPDVYFEDGTWSLDYPGVENQLKALLDYLFNLPEYQLQ